MSVSENEGASAKPVRIAGLAGPVTSAWPLIPHPDAEGASTQYGVPLRVEIGGEALMRTEERMNQAAVRLAVLLEATPGSVDVQAVSVRFAEEYGVPFTHRLHITGEQWQGPADWGVQVEAAGGTTCGPEPGEGARH